MMLGQLSMARIQYQKCNVENAIIHSSSDPLPYSIRFNVTATKTNIGGRTIVMDTKLGLGLRYYAQFLPTSAQLIYGGFRPNEAALLSDVRKSAYIWDLDLFLARNHSRLTFDLST
ncbi:hypothetical protein KIN20_005262 [Parelaphostrongylus tenuis]|uniref:Uncharacterized protein n=1 Tax=Parelaphostrongylus tenuis TaxID=148309 RepID=A0AAD5MSJ4_PARTN|nr:hypothetical protein KIN20_005262 [Parelaphostrongylus tenuis]